MSVATIIVLSADGCCVLSAEKKSVARSLEKEMHEVTKKIKK